jgi:hypothetical protein
MSAMVSMASAQLTDNEVRLITTLIWPVAVLILAGVFREPLIGLLKRLRSVEGPGFRGAFAESAEQALNQAEDLKVSEPAQSDAISFMLVLLPG